MHKTILALALGATFTVGAQVPSCMESVLTMIRAARGEGWTAGVQAVLLAFDTERAK